MRNSLLKGLRAFVFSFLVLCSGVYAEEARLIPPLSNAEKHCIVGIAQGEKGAYEETVRQAVNAAGGLSSIISEGDTVLIKPNIVAASPSGAGRITDYRVVQVVVNMALEAGAGKVIVAEGPVDDFASIAFRVAGYNKIEGAQVTAELDTDKSSCYLLKAENSLSGEAFYLPKMYIDAEVVIDVPILKTHFNAGVTLGLKNIGVGVPPKKIYSYGIFTHKQRLHDIGIHRVIVDVNAIRAPDFVVIDGMVAGEGHGPVSPTPVESNLIIAGQNVVAVDTVATLVMGFEPWQITHLVWASAQGIGPMDTSYIEVRGKQISEVQQNFIPAPSDPFPYQATTVIRYTDQPMVIDGVLSEWSEAWPNKLGYKSQIRDFYGNWNGKLDASADFMLLHDFDNLYFAFSIQDDDFQFGSDLKNGVPRKDALIICMSRDNGMENGLRRYLYAQGNDFRFVIQNLEEGIQVLSYPLSEVISGVEVKRSKTENGYILEGKIPIEDPSKSFEKYEAMFIDFILYDIDENENFVQLVWNTPKSQLRNPQSCGRALID